MSLDELNDKVVKQDLEMMYCENKYGLKMKIMLKT